VSHIRIESHEKVARNTKVIFVQDGRETDISGCVSAVDIHLEVGEVATATLKTYTGAVSVTAEVEDLVNTHATVRIEEVATLDDTRRHV
jgi:hypothetical protein